MFHKSQKIYVGNNDAPRNITKMSACKLLQV